MTFSRIFMLASSKKGLGFFAVSCLLSAVGAPKGHCLLYPFADLRLLIRMRSSCQLLSPEDRKFFANKFCLTKQEPSNRVSVFCVVLTYGI